MTDQDFLAWAARPDSIRCILIEAQALSGGQEVTRYLSSVGYVTGPDDTPPSLAYDACVVGGVNVSEQLPLSGRANVGWGDIEIANHGGERDSWLNDVWSGRPVKIWVGDPRWPRADFRLVFSGVVEDATARSNTTVNLLLRDKSQQLNTALTEETISNGSLTRDVLKPLCFGEVHNVTPVLLDEGQLTYMVHDGPIEAIIEVRDNGIPVSFGANLSAGTFALSASPVGTITASVQGAKFAGVYHDTVGPLVKEIATRYGTTPLTAEEVDIDQVNQFSAEHPQHVGIFLSSRANQLDVMQQLAASVGAQVTFDASGRLQIRKVEITSEPGAPEVGPAEMVLHSLTVASTPDVEPAFRIAYCRNYTVQSNLQTGLPPAHAELYGQEWLIVHVTDPAVAAAWKKSTTPEDTNTLLLVRVEAEEEANRRLNLWGQRRMVLRYDSAGGSLLTPLGSQVVLKHPRFGLAAGKPGQIVGKKTDWLTQKVTFEVLV